MKNNLKWKFFALALSILLIGLYSCQHSLPRYLLDQGLAQGQLLLNAKNVSQLLKQGQLSPKEEKFLKLSQEILNYAQNNYKMNVGNKYRKYYNTQRSWVTQVVSAAYQDRLETYHFKFPLFGKLPYKGYFNKQDALSLKSRLDKKNLDTSIRGVRAYSSTGWFDDPILNTMFYDLSYFIDVLFHELVHSQFYFPNEANFNEAFATWFAHIAATDFIQQSKVLSQAEKNLTHQKLEKSLKRGKDLARVIEEIQLLGKKSYESKDNLSIVRKKYFNQVQNIFHKNGFKKLAKKQWNNAKIMGYSTYYKDIQSINDYAVKYSLDAPSFLQRIINKGSEIVKEIYSTRSK